jgi:hypothetical protein
MAGSAERAGNHAMRISGPFLSEHSGQEQPRQEQPGQEQLLAADYANLGPLAREVATG